jgi:hypothetical protein
MKHACILIIVALLPLLGAQDNPAVGTWKLDVAKSKFSPGPAPKSAKLVIVADGESVKTSYEEVEADESHVGYEYTSVLDSKDHPLSGPSRPDRLSGADTVVLRPNGSRAYGAMFKKSGQVVMTNMTTVSKDGKTLTLVVNGANAKGEPVKLMTVWEKQ